MEPACTSKCPASGSDKNRFYGRYNDGGVVLVESVFSYPGIGMTLRSAVVGRDYPLIQGILLVIAVSILICNLLVDKIYEKLDPRVGI